MKTTTKNCRINIRVSYLSRTSIRLGLFFVCSFSHSLVKNTRWLMPSFPYQPSLQPLASFIAFCVHWCSHIFYFGALLIFIHYAGFFLQISCGRWITCLRPISWSTSSLRTFVCCHPGWQIYPKVVLQVCHPPPRHICCLAESVDSNTCVEKS